MPSFIKSVTVDCAAPLVVADFWASALGSDVDEDSTPEPAKNRMHFDLRAPDSIAAEVERLTGLGAVVVTQGEGLVVMRDPEGNAFCVE